MTRRGDEPTGQDELMLTLALDVDGVLLDPERGGLGNWTQELTARFGIARSEIDAAFFRHSWNDVIVGARPIEDALDEALRSIGAVVSVESVLACWFDADYVPFDEAVEVAASVAGAGHRVVLATNQEHRRARYLHHRLGAAFPIDQMLYSAELGHQKHDRRFFELASARLGVDASQGSDVVFVDDALHNVEVARSFGWHGVHASGDGAWHAEVNALLSLGSITG